MSKIVYLGHSSFLLKGNDYSLVIDPYQNGSVPNLKFPNVEPVDVVVCSHEHADHNARELVNIKNNPTPVEAVSITVLDEKTLEPFKNCDVLLAPINGFYTIGPKELKEIASVIKPRILIPMHYYMKEHNSGYPDGNMIEKFKKLFPNYQYLDKEELDLDEYKNYQGVLLFR